MGIGKGINTVGKAVLPASTVPRIPAALAVCTRRIDRLSGMG